jgi:hypothetical protein
LIPSYEAFKNNMTIRSVAASTRSGKSQIPSLIFIVLFFPLSVIAQFNYKIDQSVPVTRQDNTPLNLGWAGGLNATQYNTMDLNGDNKDDLVLFDRTADKVITYLNVDNQYVYSSDYESLFPQLTNWLLLRDYNCDGKKDIFTSDIFGIKVFINTTTSGPLTWEQYFTYNGVGGHSPVILTKGFTSKINLQLQFDDLPAINDMDGDGDLDILAMRFPAGGTIEFHKNFSKERYGTCDSLDFERIDQSWGDVAECGCGNFEFNGNDCPDGGRVKHAGGKTILALDVDGDADQDVLFSEASCNQLYLLRNTGTVANAVVASSSFFPQNSPVNFELFPGAYFEDVDFDNVKDLVVSPNIYLNDFPANFPDLKQSNWFYKNTGTNTSPNFSFVKSSFLQDQMIDIGDNAVPAFADHDKDGDLDMFISYFSSNAFVGSIALYRNEGTSSEPEFVFETNDYFGFSILNHYNIRMQWVDITGDGNIDLVFTATSFQSGLTSLYYLENKSSGSFSFDDEQSTGFSLIRSENAYLVDVDEDGVLDILLGKSNGALQYWRNTGANGTFNYVLEDDSYLGLSTSVTRQNLRALVADLEADGEDDLILGDQTGTLQIISDFRDQSDASGIVTDIVYNNILEEYLPANLGGRTWPEAANLFNSNKPTLIVGNIMGGLIMLRNENDKPLPDEPDINIYPIPVSSQDQNLNIRADRPVVVEIFNMVGQRVTPPAQLKANRWNEFSVSSLSGGIYLLRFISGDKSVVRRIVVY